MRNSLSALLFSALVTLALTVGCELDVSNLGVPVWTVEATIPFSERVYLMQELVTDSNRFEERGWGMFVNENDSIMRFEYIEDLDTQFVGDRLKYSASDTGRYINEINRIHVEEPPVEANRIIVDEINDLLHPSPNPVVVQPFVFTETRKMMVFDVFKWAQIYQGTLTITVWNHFPFAIENLDVSIRNLSSDVELGRALFDNVIAPGGSDQRAVDLSGQYVEHELLFVTNGQSPGTAPGSVVIPEGAQMELSVRISEMDVDSTHAQVGAQSFLKDDALVLEDDDKVVEAVVNLGNAYFRLTNSMPFKITCDMEFTNIVDSLNNPLTQVAEIAPLSPSESYVLELNDRIIRMDVNDQRLWVQNRVSIEDTRVTMFNDTSYQTIAGYQGVNVEYWTDELTLKSYSGVPHQIEVEIPEQTTAIDLPRGPKNFNFTRDTLFIRVQNDADFKVMFNLDVISSNSESGLSETIHHQSPITPGYNVITIPDVDALASVVPDTIRALGWIGLGDVYFPENTGNIRYISADQCFTGSVRLKSALRLTAGESVFLMDPVSVKEKLDYAVQDMLMKVRIVNALPLSGMIKIMMGNDTTAMDTVLQTSLPVPPVGDNHRVVEPVEERRELELSPEQIDIVRRLPLYTQQEIVVFGTEGDTVWIYGMDSLTVQASVKFHYIIDVDKESNR